MAAQGMVVPQGVTMIVHVFSGKWSGVGLLPCWAAQGWRRGGAACSGYAGQVQQGLDWYLGLAIAQHTGGWRSSVVIHVTGGLSVVRVHLQHHAGTQEGPTLHLQQRVFRGGGLEFHQVANSRLHSCCCVVQDTTLPRHCGHATHYQQG